MRFFRLYLLNYRLTTTCDYLTRWCSEDEYGVTYDHLVSDSDSDPEVVQFNLVDPTKLLCPVLKRNGQPMTNSDGAVLTEQDVLKIALDGDEYQDCVVAVPRCCQVRRGKTDRARVNYLVKKRQATVDLYKQGGEKADGSPSV